MSQRFLIKNLETEVIGLKAQVNSLVISGGAFPQPYPNNIIINNKNITGITNLGGNLGGTNPIGCLDSLDLQQNSILNVNDIQVSDVATSTLEFSTDAGRTQTKAYMNSDIQTITSTGATIQCSKTGLHSYNLEAVGIDGGIVGVLCPQGYLTSSVSNNDATITLEVSNPTENNMVLTSNPAQVLTWKNKFADPATIDLDMGDNDINNIKSINGNSITMGTSTTIDGTTTTTYTTTISPIAVSGDLNMGGTYKLSSHPMKNPFSQTPNTKQVLKCDGAGTLTWENDIDTDTFPFIGQATTNLDMNGYNITEVSTFSGELKDAGTATERKEVDVATTLKMNTATGVITNHPMKNPFRITPTTKQVLKCDSEGTLTWENDIDIDTNIFVGNANANLDMNAYNIIDVNVFQGQLVDAGQATERKEVVLNSTLKCDTQDGIIQNHPMINPFRITPTSKQVLKCDTAGVLTWEADIDTDTFPFIGTATSNLDMRSNDVVGIDSIQGKQVDNGTATERKEVDVDTTLKMNTTTGFITNHPMKNPFRITPNTKQVLKCDSAGTLTWEDDIDTDTDTNIFVGSATTNLDMNGYNITEVATLSGQIVSAGTATERKEVDVDTTLKMNTTTGFITNHPMKNFLRTTPASKQVLNCDSAGTLTWETDAGGNTFVSTATSSLNMGGFEVNNIERLSGKVIYDAVLNASYEMIQLSSVVDVNNRWLKNVGRLTGLVISEVLTPPIPTAVANVPFILLDSSLYFRSNEQTKNFIGNCSGITNPNGSVYIQSLTESVNFASKTSTTFSCVQPATGNDPAFGVYNKNITDSSKVISALSIYNDSFQMRVKKSTTETDTNTSADWWWWYLRNNGAMEFPDETQQTTAYIKRALLSTPYADRQLSGEGIAVNINGTDVLITSLVIPTRTNQTKIQITATLRATIRDHINPADLIIYGKNGTSNFNASATIIYEFRETYAVDETGKKTTLTFTTDTGVLSAGDNNTINIYAKGLDTASGTGYIANITNVYLSCEVF